MAILFLIIKLKVYEILLPDTLEPVLAYILCLLSRNFFMHAFCLSLVKTVYVLIVFYQAF